MISLDCNALHRAVKTVFGILSSCCECIFLIVAIILRARTFGRGTVRRKKKLVSARLV